MLCLVLPWVCFNHNDKQTLVNDIKGWTNFVFLNDFFPFFRLLVSFVAWESTIHLHMENLRWPLRGKKLL